MTATIGRKEWKKLYKKCKHKILYPRCGDGGSDPRCVLLAGIRWGRCWYSKCPEIHKEEK